MSPTPQNTQFASIVQKIYKHAVLCEVLYQMPDSGLVFSLEVTKAMRKECERIDEDAQGEYDDEDGFIEHIYITPDDLSEAELLEFIEALHDEENDEPLYTAIEWKKMNTPADVVGYPFYFSFEIENYGHSLHIESYEEIVNGENLATAWARVSPFEEPKVRLARIAYRGVDVLPFLTKVLRGTKHVEAIFNTLEFKAQEIYQRLYE